jgi:hypothetical protein
METGIHVGNKIDAKEAVGPVAKAVMDVLKAISDCRIDREVALKALDVVSLYGQPQAVISNCNISSYPRAGERREVPDDDDDGRPE